MADDLPTHLQALYNSGEITGFISARMPSEKLTTGWMEHGLLQKALTGKLQDKKNQEHLIIPADRFARLTRDLEGTTDSFVGLLIIGHRGLKKPKFYVLIYRAPDDNSESMTTVAFWTKTLSPSDIIHSIARRTFGQSTSSKKSEPDFDYIEQIRIDVSMGLVQDLLSLRVKKGKHNTANWIRDAIMSVESHDEVIAYAGKMERISRSALLFSRWITTLELFKENEENIAAILMKFENRMDSCFWDGPRELATFATINGTDIQKVVDSYISSMWTDTEDIDMPRPRTPEVIIGKVKDSESSAKESKIESVSKKSTITLNEIQERIVILEKKIHALDSTFKDQPGSVDQSISMVQTRLADIIDRLESLAARLSELEIKLKGVGKTTR
ncbi:MAG: hypothetical protein BV458_13405 [Thermoplasmata archaeon M9B2D]|nr:MAG: hypothetical protein BV458_13405 [Thermoplasmata archaeon M9B2D]